MDKWTFECSTGAVLFSQTIGIQWWSTKRFLKTDESLDDYAKFQYSVHDILSSLVVSAINENELYDEDYLTIEELMKLQNHYFITYARSCGLIQHNDNVGQVFRDGVLDWKSFFPRRHEVTNDLDYYIMELEELHRVHKFFAYRKCLAKYDFIKWDSNSSEIFRRLEFEKKWPELSDASLRLGLDQHLSLLELNRNLGMTGLASVCNMPQGNRLLEAINKEYADQLGDVIKKFEKRWRKNYFDHIKLKNLLHNRADQARFLRTLPILQDCHLITKLTCQSPIHQKLFQLKDRALAAESWILENFTRLKGRAGGKYYEGPLTRSLRGFLLFAGSLTAVGIGMQKASR